VDVVKEIPLYPIPANAAAGGCDCCGADAGRRQTLRVVAGAVLVAGMGVPPASAEEGPRKGDLLVLADDEAHKPLTAADVKAGEKPLIAWPFDPAAKAVRDSTRLNRVLLVRVDPSKLDAATAPRAAEGVVAYSAFCTHQGCDVNSWVAAEKVLLCFCHFSKFDPTQEAAVTGGPAPRPLPALPIALQDGKLVVAGGFTTPPGKAA
jgi:Rieske Fe-S protein